MSAKPKSQLKSVEETYVYCRTLGHSWVPGVANPEKRRALFGTRVTFQCLRCGMQRHDLIDRLGQVAHRAYDRPEGYTLTESVRLGKKTVKQTVKYTRSEWRMEMVKRITASRR